MRYSKTSGDFERLDPCMTPMIDVCFQMILFFIVNMRLFAPEGDFPIEMRLAAPRAGLPKDSQMPVIKVRLHADGNGNLAGIQMGQRTLATLAELHRAIRELMGLDRGHATPPSDAEVELDCDYNLKFEHAMDALTAISGYLAEDNQTVIHMIEKIRFSPPRKAS